MKALAWAAFAAAGLALLAPMFVVLRGGACGACEHWSFRPRRGVPAFLQEFGEYGLVIRCRGCTGLTLEGFEKRLLEMLYSEEERTRFVRFVGEGFDFPDRSDPARLRAWIHGFCGDLRAHFL